MFPCATARSRGMQNPRAPYNRSTPALRTGDSFAVESFRGKRLFSECSIPPESVDRVQRVTAARERRFGQFAGLDVRPFPTYDCSPLKLPWREVNNDEVPIPASSNMSRAFETMQGDGFRISRNLSRSQGRQAFRPGCCQRGLHHRGPRISGNPFCA